jgi:uncharacterized protein (DUF2062 family)
MVTQSVPAHHHSWIYRRTVLPILALLRMGATPRRLAWSIAVGLLIGVNPVVGTTTLLCVVLAIVFRLNIVAMQIANHLVFPLEVLLVLPMIRLGAYVFHTAPLPFSAHVFLMEARHTPLRLARQVWLWEWHAFLLWVGIAVVAMPLVAAGLTPMLERLLARIQRHQYPVVTLGVQDSER